MCIRNTTFYHSLSQLFFVYREELWYERLRDTPLSIVHNPKTKDVYIGLADGTLAVIEVEIYNPRRCFTHIP